MKTKRRDFLKLATAAAVAPWIWIPKKAYAASTPGFGLTKHVLVLYAKGGLRSHVMFNAVGNELNNPFGAGPALAGRQWAIGAAAGTTPIVTSTQGTLPSFASISNQLSVLTCVDHDPTAANDINHATASLRIATGSPTGLTGLLSMVGHDLPVYSNGFSMSAVPPVEIVPTEFGLGSGDYGGTQPLSLLSAQGSFAAGLPIGQGWQYKARGNLDSRFENTRSRAFRLRMDEFLTAKRDAITFAGMLTDPRLNVLSAPTATDAGFTNAQLIDVLGNYKSLDASGNSQSWGPDVAMALRFFAFGSPLAIVTRDQHDLHADEEDYYVPRVEDLLRQLVGLNYLLKLMPHPSGGTYWDHTIVSVVSEFSRNNTMANGYNSGRGSDHVTTLPGPQRNQALPLMGGPISASAGKAFGATDANINATGTVYTSKQLLSTWLDALGLPATTMATYWPDAPISELYG